MTLKLLSENKDKLELVAKALLKYETLDAAQFMKAYNGELDLSDEDAAVENPKEKFEEANVPLAEVVESAENLSDAATVATEVESSVETTDNSSNSTL